ncbi:hypothetical protein KVT40_006117 [Elsinoe batatas]|uniref:Plasmid pRiA4b Orf3-like domain-containing protein n=1 Tax=Elsinoe batatas TaxID=2601811 RepID=A0A8K0L138_9PEZI|nr:hypothetical protein KVT40_006117 [Elsinoe batatas]
MVMTCAGCGRSSVRLLKCSRCQSREYCATGLPIKSLCERQNYVLKVDLHPRHITNPRISRTLSCPAASTFAKLHTALIVAFGWSNTHLYDFAIYAQNIEQGRENRLSGPQPIYKITDPASEEDTFEMPGMPPSKDSSRMKLFQVLDNATTKAQPFTYEYDFGDGWEHVITCTGRAPTTDHFVCLDGEGHGCAEDVGGWHSWLGLREAYDAPNPDRDQKERRKWFERFASNGDPEGLRGELKWRWDKENINRVLAEHRTSRPNRQQSCLPNVLLLSLGKVEWFDEMYGPLLSQLRAKATVIERTHISSVMEALSTALSSYAAVVITDATILQSEMEAVRSKVVDYARNGGTLLISFSFSSFATPPLAKRFFKDTLGVDWSFGGYERSTFQLNMHPQTTLYRRGSESEATAYDELKEEFSMKALHLKDVAENDRVYIAPHGSRQTPAAFSKYGEGYLGYIGDVNTEVEVGPLLLRMCGV